MTTAAFRASYSDWKVIKGRKVVQIVFEMPLETADQAYQALGGMPIAAHEVWCGIARLDPSKEYPLPPHPAEAAPRPASSSPQPLPAGENKQKRPFGTITPAEQAGILCNEQAFHKFLIEKHYRVWMRCDDLTDTRRAANCVREICKVDSRADIKPDNAVWSALVLAYRLWQREPEFV
jgi:hypothetical protein